MIKTHTIISSIASIKAQMSRIENNTNLYATPSMDDFLILKAFDISLRPHRAPFIKEII